MRHARRPWSSAENHESCTGPGERDSREAEPQQANAARYSSGKAGSVTSETVTALRNHDWLVRHRGLDTVAFARDRERLIYGDDAASNGKLTRPGFTPARSPERAPANCRLAAARVGIAAHARQRALLSRARSLRCLLGPPGTPTDRRSPPRASPRPRSLMAGAGLRLPHYTA
jgi:hypothetical protein